MWIQSFEMKAFGILVLSIAIVSGCSNAEVGQGNAVKTEQGSSAAPVDEKAIASIVSSEELILSLTPKLKKLNRSLFEPYRGFQSHFASRCRDRSRAGNFLREMGRQKPG